MTVTCGFFNSVDGDRVYNSVQMSSIFDGVITDGIFAAYGDAMAVTAGDGLVVVVGEGKAWFNHTWTLNDADLTLYLDTPDALLARIDTVILEVDSSDEVRANSIKILEGTPASEPVPTALTNTTTLHQYALAYVAVAAQETDISSGDITSLIGTEDCPYVTGPLESFILTNFHFVGRQGYEATNWALPGTNNFTPDNVSVQAGCHDGTGGGIIAVTFPVAFSATPLVFVTCDDPPDHFISMQVGYVTATGFTGYLIEHLTDAPYHQRLNHVSSFHWLAIGPT